MRIIGVTTMHIFAVEYIGARGRLMYNLKPSRNGWQSSVTMWTGKESAIEQSMTFLRLVKARGESLYPEFDDWTIENGPMRCMLAGVIYTEKMLFGRFNGMWQVFAKVEIAYGPESSMRAWEANEKREWLDWI